MAYTTIPDPSAQFQPTTYTGNGGAQTITNIGNSNLKPDLVWIKTLGVGDNVLVDSTRGATKELKSNSNVAESTASNGVTGFVTDGFTANGAGDYNGNGGNYVSWQWKANGGTTATNTDGSITSYTQANTTAGFSMVKWTGNTNGNFTVGHGLGAVPKVLVVKKFSGTSNWYCRYAAALNGNNSVLYWNSNNAEASESTVWYSTAPTSSVFTIGTDANLATASDYIAYCWAPIKGYSHFGNYQGDGIAAGPFVYTGFRPAYIMIKNISVSQSWIVFDSRRPGYNETNKSLNISESGGEETGRIIDICSTGFKIRSLNTACNGDNNYHVYMAFAEQPLVSSGITNVGFA